MYFHRASIKDTQEKWATEKVLATLLCRISLTLLQEETVVWVLKKEAS